MYWAEDDKLKFCAIHNASITLKLLPVNTFIFMENWQSSVMICIPFWARENTAYHKKYSPKITQRNGTDSSPPTSWCNSLVYVSVFRKDRENWPYWQDFSSILLSFPLLRGIRLRRKICVLVFIVFYPNRGLGCTERSIEANSVSDVRLAVLG